MREFLGKISLHIEEINNLLKLYHVKDKVKISTSEGRAIMVVDFELIDVIRVD